MVISATHQLDPSSPRSKHLLLLPLQAEPLSTCLEGFLHLLVLGRLGKLLTVTTQQFLGRILLGQLVGGIH
jgi:hypothetical protein